MRVLTTVQSFNTIRLHDVCQIDASSENLPQSSRSFHTRRFPLFAPRYKWNTRVAFIRLYVARMWGLRFNSNKVRNRTAKPFPISREIIIWIINFCIYWFIYIWCCFTKQEYIKVIDILHQTEFVYLFRVFRILQKYSFFLSFCYACQKDWKKCRGDIGRIK